MDGFLRKELEEAGFGWVLFPAPIEVWVVSYVEDPKGVTVHV